MSNSVPLIVVTIFYGLFTLVYILLEDSVRWAYRSKSQELPLTFASWWRYIKRRHLILPTLWRAPLAVIGNGLIVFALGLFIGIFAQPLMPYIGYNVFTIYGFILLLSGWSWHTIVPSIYARWIHDKSNKVALLFENEEPA